MKKYLDKKIIILFLLSIIYAIFSVYVYRITSLTIHLGMVWNLFLSIIPFILSYLLIFTVKQKWQTISIVIAISWLLFFPNAPYMITGFIHLSTIAFYTTGEFEIISWIRLVHFALGISLGIKFGMLSLYNIHQLLLKYYNTAVVYVSLLAISLLSGYAIYVGRLLRLNSWDVLQPISLANEMITNLNSFAIFSSLLFAFYIMFTYIIYYYFIKKEN